jgi:Caspase domain
MPDRLALIIANSEYEDPKLSRLLASSRDALALGEALQDPEIGDFETITLVNATQGEVAKAINRLYLRRTKDDLLLLYYSGHGIKDDYGDLYLAVRDTETEILAATSIDVTFIRRQIDKCQSRRNVILLDCCYSGAFFSEGVKAALESSTGLQEILSGNGYGRVVLTASNALEYAWEGDQVFGSASPSVFTRYLAQGLQSGEADLNLDGFISLDELYEYVYEQVVSSGQARQTPLKWAQKVEGQIIIARSPFSRVITPKAAPAPKLSVKLSNTPAKATAGEEVRWTVSITNNSPEEVGEVEVHHELNLIRQPFSIPTGTWRWVAFQAQYSEPGEYVETVEISAVTHDGRRVFYEASKSIDVLAPPADLIKG